MSVWISWPALIAYTCVFTRVCFHVASYTLSHYLSLFSRLKFPPRTVFPAGTYLISDTIIINRTLGVAWMGMGRTTILKWIGGPAPTNSFNNVSVMAWSDGNTRHYMEGISFDAGNGCAVGLDHANKQGSQYESFNTHRNMR